MSRQKNKPSAPTGATLFIEGEHQDWCIDLSESVAAKLRERPSMRRRIDAILDVALAEVTQVIHDLLEGEDSLAEDSEAGPS
jgi:hypothetical protein